MNSGSEKRNVTTAQAMEIMRKNGVEIDEKKGGGTIGIAVFFS